WVEELLPVQPLPAVGAHQCHHLRFARSAHRTRWQNFFYPAHLTGPSSSSRSRLTSKVTFGTSLGDEAIRKHAMFNSPKFSPKFKINRLGSQNGIRCKPL